MSEVFIPMEAVQYLNIVQVVLYFIWIICLGLASVAVAILLGGE